MSVDQRRRTAARRRPLADPDEVPLGGSIEEACWFADDVLVALVSFDDELPAQFETLLHTEDGWQPCETVVAPFELASRGNAEARTDRLIVVRMADGTDGELGALVFRSRAGDVVLEAPRRDFISVEVEHLVRALRSTPAELHSALVDFLVRATAGTMGARRQLAAALNRVREGLRLNLPLSVVDPSEAHAVAIDAVWRLDDQSFYIEGWVRHEDAELVSLTAVSPEGERIELADTVFRYCRPDVSEFYGLDTDAKDHLGFIAYFETDVRSVLHAGWVIEARDSLGGKTEGWAPPVMRDLAAARSTILGDLLLERLPADSLKTTHLRPALGRLQQRLAARVGIDTIDQFGAPPKTPDVSIVVPLYRRVDFLEHQLAQFVHDPELYSVDLIYVLDSPEQAEYLRSYATQLHRLYELPFRVVTLTGNGGFSIANNLGASVALGRLLLLLNSDVLPERPGWVGEMVRFYDADPHMGALSPKLVYEDDSLQHAGLYFGRPEGTHVWANEHYFKGMHRNLPAANVARSVPSVTGACLMISRELFDEHGGLRGDYVQGDYEDSDLCIRLAAEGRKSWYLPAVALYHLEGQSYSSDERALASQYNKWLHTHLWNDAIERSMAKAGAR